MELYGILNAALPDIDDEACLTWATPRTHYRLAGELSVSGDGLGAALHALFKVFFYYPYA